MRRRFTTIRTEHGLGLAQLLLQIGKLRRELALSPICSTAIGLGFGSHALGFLLKLLKLLFRNFGALEKCFLIRTLRALFGRLRTWRPLLNRVFETRVFR